SSPARAFYDSRVSAAATNDAPLVLIMAAGEGTRMRSSLPKALHPVCGRPMVAWPVLAAKEAGADPVAVIVSPDRDLSPGLPNGTRTIVQPEADGTGGAIRAALDLVRKAETVVVIPGDHPLVSAELVTELLDAHAAAQAAATVMTLELDDAGSYGRIVRDPGGDVERIVETKHPESVAPEVLAIREISTSTFAFAAAPLADALERITDDNEAGEYYLGDVLPLLRASGLRVRAHRANDPAANLGVNTRADLALATGEARRRILHRHMLAGVTLIDPDSTWIDADVELAPDVTIEPGTTLRGSTAVGPGSRVGPHTTLIDARLGENVTVPHSYLVECEVGDGCQVGPFAYLRPGTRLAPGAKAGTFVEIKNSEVGEGAKVPHLAYVGDAEVGAGSNLGAGSITANYDGFRKNRTKIGERARIGVNNSLVAPVSVGDDAYTGAGAVIRKDVPEGALGVTKGEQRNIEGYAKRKAREHESTKRDGDDD
ncbi:MAG TPA: bifunctional UDP-N-acetylglucosamine diphosphorylase/glucosamine-1-phosphate N-acetyltransferase GlmU, partial [Solirubrobacterales bacterium]|nr:bifunctional UDP-N-acetylglucosamine diphosphorylase/glucosamine-1-phosphate N-acetyltransferase GlmU [Solirubrobacterales bacterium]